MAPPSANSPGLRPYVPQVCQRVHGLFDEHTCFGWDKIVRDGDHAVLVPLFHYDRWWGRSIETVSGRNGIGVAIRFRP